MSMVTTTMPKYDRANTNLVVLIATRRATMTPTGTSLETATPRRVIKQMITIMVVNTHSMISTAVLIL